MKRPVRLEHNEKHKESRKMRLGRWWSGWSHTTVDLFGLREDVELSAKT